MKLLFVRHGDPDYDIDSLTPQGKIEAELLSERLCKLSIKEFYTSPLGRAKDTAKYTLEKMGREAVECEWLREFWPVINKPNEENSIVWDWLPNDWTFRKDFYSRENWASVPELDEANVAGAYRYVINNFDALLKKHGYERKYNYYNAVNANEDTLVFFCHFGIECVILSYLLGVSPMILWHGFCAAPSSVTTVVTEEREKGIAYFRISSFGDVSHLYKENVEPSFAARFCETYDNFSQRH